MQTDQFQWFVWLCDYVTLATKVQRAKIACRLQIQGNAFCRRKHGVTQQPKPSTVTTSEDVWAFVYCKTYRARVLSNNHKKLSLVYPFRLFCSSNTLVISAIVSSTLRALNPFKKNLSLSSHSTSFCPIFMSPPSNTVSA